jgi:hypothetical protein
MRIRVRPNPALEPTSAASENYLLSVFDSDGDEVLTDALVEAANCASAWSQATTIAFRACRGSGAVPVTLTVVRVPHAHVLVD